MRKAGLVDDSIPNALLAERDRGETWRRPSADWDMPLAEREGEWEMVGMVPLNEFEGWRVCGVVAWCESSWIEGRVLLRGESSAECVGDSGGEYCVFALRLLLARVKVGDSGGVMECVSAPPSAKL